MFDITNQVRAFEIMVGNAAFRWVQLFANSDFTGLAKEAEGELVDPTVIENASEEYWQQFPEVMIDANARARHWINLGEKKDGKQLVEQIICDPEAFNEWRLNGFVDINASREAGEAILRLTAIGRLNGLG